MVHRILADVVVTFHLAFVLFVVLGALFVRRWRWIMWLHLPAVAWGVIVEWTGWTCPLTPVENWLRVWGEEAGYTGGFIDQYVTAVLYPTGLPPAAHRLLGVAVLAVNLVLYWRVLSPPRAVTL
ncbi:MAG: DUF2784 domain-containing protein [Candidatus Binatia bacterium]|nr:DUF2784 domain-containing protein [Candidatus Binatia bacterium]